MNNEKIDKFLSDGRALQIEAERQRKKGDLPQAGYNIGKSAINHLKAVCLSENIACAGESDYFAAAGELARRFRKQNINRQFGEAILLYLNGINKAPSEDNPAIIRLTGDQIKTYFKDVQKMIHLLRDRMRFIE